MEKQIKSKGKEMEKLDQDIDEDKIDRNFDVLARDYVAASDSVDDYDLHSEIPEQVKKFDKLLLERSKAENVLRAFVLEEHDLEQLEKTKG